MTEAITPYVYEEVTNALRGGIRVVTDPKYGASTTAADNATAFQACANDGAGICVVPGGSFTIKTKIVSGARVLWMVAGTVNFNPTSAAAGAAMTWEVAGQGGRGSGGGCIGPGRLQCNRKSDYGFNLDSWHGGVWDLEICDPIVASFHAQRDQVGGSVNGAFPSDSQDCDAWHVGCIHRSVGGFTNDQRPQRFALINKASDGVFHAPYVEGLSPGDGVGIEVVDGAGRIMIYAPGIFDNTRAYAGGILLRTSSASTTDQVSCVVQDLYNENQMKDAINFAGGYTLPAESSGVGHPNGTIVVDSTDGFTNSGSITCNSQTIAYTNKTGTTFTGCTGGTGTLADNAVVVQANWFPYAVKVQVDSGAGGGSKYHRITGTRQVSTAGANARRLWLQNDDGGANLIRGVHAKDPRAQLSTDGQIFISSGCGFNHVTVVDSGNYPFHITDNGNNNVLRSLTERASLFDDHADDPGGTATAETDLHSHALPANIMDQTDDKVEAWFAGTITANNDATPISKQLKVKLGTDIILDTGTFTNTLNDNFYSCDIKIIRVSSNTVRCWARLSRGASGASGISYSGYIEISPITLSSAQTLKMTATMSASHSPSLVTSQMGTVRRIEAAA